MIGTLKNLNEKEKKIIDLLDFAFKQEGQWENDYFIGQEDEAWRVGDIYCLIQTNDHKWQVFGLNRESKGSISQFDDLSHATKFFFWQKMYTPSQYKYRDEWTKVTGQEM